jgi:ABC-type phosphate/phosphonate transport system substrate-binding protein
MTARVPAAALALSALLALAGTTGAGEPAPARAPEAVPVRIVYTASIFRDLAEPDIRAAIKVYAEALAREMGVAAYSEAQVLQDGGGLAQLFEARKVEFGCTTFPEFLEIGDRLDADPIFAVNQGGAITVEYLVLVRRDSPCRRLADLRGAELRIFDSPRCSVAIPWLELELAREGIGAAAGFFKLIVPAAKLSAVVLPVFFGQAEACLVTRSGFQTMVELNPQVGRDLRVLAESPGVVPIVGFLRGSFDAYFRQDLIDAVTHLDRRTAGRQILNLMQGDGLVIAPAAALDGTRALMKEWSRRGPGLNARKARGAARTVSQAGMGR